MPIINDERLPRRYIQYRQAMGTGVEPMAEWERELLATTEREEQEVPTTSRRCHRCGIRESSENAYINWYEAEGNDYCHSCVTRCIRCRELGDLDQRRQRGGYCRNCEMTCYNCGVAISNDNNDDDDSSDVRSWQLWDVRAYCTNCLISCPGCGERQPSNNMISIDDDLYCEGCTNYCDDCDEYRVGPCDCQCGDRVRGYGSTEAMMWLGGPLPKIGDTDEDNGYYIGFELEIAASDGRRRTDVTPIKDWAERHLGNRDALDCKHDGSVQGFEIASQPMTPEFFENVDWESFMEVLNEHYPLSAFNWEDEPREHGLHVHIGRVAFRRDDVAQAAYSYLLSQDDHLERIGRREPYHYCAKVLKPVSASVVQAKPYGRQGRRLSNQGIGVGRDAVNLTNNRTIEIRAFKSTRKANELRDAVRVTYLAAEYIRELRSGGWKSTSKALHWLEFAAWVGTNYPQAFASISGISTKPGSNRFPVSPKFWV